MLQPTKHSHPDKTVINLSLLLLSYVKAKRSEEYEALRKYAKKKLVGCDVLFLPALNLLFLLGLIEYRPKNDLIEYVGKNENI